MRTILLFCWAWFTGATTATACPFCTAVKPTFAQQRDAAVIVALAEKTGVVGDKQVFRIDRVLKGSDQVKPAQSLAVPADVPTQATGLVLLVGAGVADAPVDRLEWTCTALNETSAAYFVRAPDLRTPNGDRLQYFAQYLEHADPLIAEDVFLEFGHASLEDVTRVADRLPMDRVRSWISDPGIPAGRKGFYGLALGLATTKADQEANQALLRQQIVEPASDFRAGFDGMLAGLLLLGGESALELIDTRYLSQAKAADGDVRHALSALRFYQEFGRSIAADRLAAALRHLLARPEFAATVIADLARWQDWDAMDQIVDLYRRPEYSDGATRRAIVGYLRACPLPRAAAQLDQLRRIDPQGLSEVERQLPPVPQNAK